MDLTAGYVPQEKGHHLLLLMPVAQMTLGMANA
jgi:hypothetical protein